MMSIKMKMMTNWPPTQILIENKTYQSRDRWRSLREFGRPTSDSLPRGWSRWPAMFLDHDQDVMFENAIQDYNVYSHDILWMVMSSTSTMWSLTRIRPSQPATESSTTLWTLVFDITFTFLSSHLLFLFNYTQVYFRLYSGNWCLA